MAIQGNGIGVMEPYDERLASLPQVARKNTAGDGTEPGGSAGLVPSQPQTADDRMAADGILAPVGKTLKDATPDVKFRTVEQLIRSQDPLARNRWAIDTHFRRVRAGVPFSRLEKIPNQSTWVAKLPNGMSKESSAAVPNKADDLCNKVEDTLMADPAKLIASPHIEDESAKMAADLASQFLTLDGGEAGTNDIATYRWALNNAFTAAASVLHYLVDRSGGGYQPLQKLAHPKATDPANPLVALVPDPTAQPQMSQFGQVDAPVPPPMIEEQATDPILRYVSPPDEQFPAGQFVDDAMQADKVWLPKIVIEKHRRESVRCFPANATVEDAAAVAFIRYCTLAEARAFWPETVGKMTMEELQGLAGWKPAMSDLVVPYAFKAVSESGATGPSLDDVGSFSPLLQRRMYAYRFYIKSTPEYQSGYWIDVTGADGGKVLGEGDLEYTVTLPTGGKETRCRDIPAVMIRPMQDVTGGDPMGWPFISRFAGASEADATLLAAFMDVCDNMLHPHVFIMGTSAINEDEWFDRSLPTIVDPSDKMPVYEQFPTLPPILPLIQELDKKQDTISGLTATAQGLDSSNAVSGTAKNATIRQALVALSGFQQNLHAGQMRGGRIKCQLVQAEFSTAQLMDYTGEEGSNEPRWWTGEDFAGVDRVGIQPGTGTMMTPEGKAQYVAFLQSQAWMTTEEGAEVALPGIRTDLGLPKNPFSAAIERSVGAFLKGPPMPKGVTDPSQSPWIAEYTQYEHKKLAYDQQQQAAQQQTAQLQAVSDHDASQGATPAMPVQPPQVGPAPLPPFTPFPPRPNDGEPAVAKIYAARLSKLFVDPQFAKQPHEWQMTAVEAYGRYMQALQPAPAMPAPQARPGQKAPQPTAPKIQQTGAAPSAPSAI
jgi:hypothetical protein